MKQELQWIPFFMLLTREIRRFGKVLIQTVVAPLITSSLYLLVFGVSLGQKLQVGDVPYLAFLIPGLVMMGCLNNAFQNCSSTIVSAKFGGDLEDFRVAPLSRLQIIWALAFGGLARGVIVGSITFAVGELFYYVVHGELLPVKEPLAFVGFMALGGLCFAMIGISVGFWSKSVDQISAVGSFIILPLIYLGGVFFSLENLHPFWQNISKFNPLLYFINGVRFGVLGWSDVNIVYATVIAIATLLTLQMVALRSLKTGSFTRW